MTHSHINTLARFPDKRINKKCSICKQLRCLQLKMIKSMAFSGKMIELDIIILKQ